MKKVLVLGLLSLIMFPLAAKADPATTNRYEHPAVFVPSEKPACPHAEIKQRLNLTEEQKAQAKSLRLASQEKIKPIAEELAAKQSRKMELKSLGGDKQEIEQLGLEIKKLKQQMHGLIMQNEREFVQILTPEQKAEFHKIKEERKRELRGLRN